MAERSGAAPEDRPLGRSSGPEVLKDDGIITKTFLLTVSPKEPVTVECQNAIRTYIMTHCTFFYVVLETGRSGKLHLHAVMVFETHKVKKKLQENINNRLVRPCGHPEAKNGIATKVQVCPGHKWYDEYLKKETGVKVIANHYDRDLVTAYFPTEEVQTVLQVLSRSRGNSDQLMAEHERQWAAFSLDSTYESCVRYLKDRMYVKRDLLVITDKRRFCQFAFALYEYRNQITEPTSYELSHFTTMTTKFDFSPP